MFEYDSTRTFVEAAAEEVLDMYTSINRSTVAIPGREPESAQAFIVSVYKDGLYHVYIYLYLGGSNEGLIYRWSEGGVPGDQLNGVYQGALEFTESMGFMMDNMRYREKNPEEKQSVFHEVPVFHEDLSFLKPEPKEEPIDELLIESVDDENSSIEVVAEDAEEINLDVLGADDEIASVELDEGGDDVAEITLGGAREESVELGLEREETAVELDGGDAEGVEEISLDDEEESALDALAVEDEAPAIAAPEPVMEESPEPVLEEDAGQSAGVEDSLLDALEITEEPEEAPEEIEAEEMTLEQAADEQTMEAEPMPEAIFDDGGAVGEEKEVQLTPEEAQVLGVLDAPEDEAPEVEEISIEGEDMEAEPEELEPPAEPEPPAFEPPPEEPEPEPEEEEIEVSFDAPEVPEEEPVPDLEPPVPSAAPWAPAPAGSTSPALEGDFTGEEIEELARFLAMM